MHIISIILGLWQIYKIENRYSPLFLFLSSEAPHYENKITLSSEMKYFPYSVLISVIDYFYEFYFINRSI